MSDSEKGQDSVTKERAEAEAEKSLAPRHIAELQNYVGSGFQGNLAEAIEAALEILDPKPTLADGLYERVDARGDLTVVYVRDGVWGTCLRDGSLHYPLPIEDPTEFTLIPTLPPLTDERRWLRGLAGRAMYATSRRARHAGPPGMRGAGMSAIEHRGRTYRPASEVKPKDGDRVALLTDPGQPCEVVTDGVARIDKDGDLMLGTNRVLRLSGDGGWSDHYVHIIERAPDPSLPEGDLDEYAEADADHAPIGESVDNDGTYNYYSACGLACRSDGSAHGSDEEDPRFSG